MSPDEHSGHPTAERNRPHRRPIGLWIFAGLWILYFGFFAILCLDSLVFKTSWVSNFLYRIDLNYNWYVRDVLQVIYFPLVRGMKFMKIVPE